LTAPWFARRVGLEWALMVGVFFIGVGQILRALSSDTTAFLGWSILALAGIGASNVLLPPIIKKYFPDRVAFMSALYVSVAVGGTMFPPLLAAPMAAAVNWRFSIASWALIAFAALIPWSALLIRRRPVDRPPEAPHSHKITRLVWASPISWAITLGFAISSMNAYTAFAWLPTMLQERAGMTPEETGSALALYVVMGLAPALFAPILVARMNNVSSLFYLSSATLIAGYLGLLLMPQAATLLWIALIGLGPLLFPVCLVLINYRTRTQAGSVALSGMAQGVGYAIGAIGPLAVGLIHALTPSWTPMLLMLMGTALVGIFAGFILRKSVMVDGSPVGSPAPSITD
ncbi:MAG: MFS transporter, partial [Actinomycetales bacterium]|nr:MFS transporter [Actinomycetales bacterium]